MKMRVLGWVLGFICIGLYSLPSEAFYLDRGNSAYSCQVTKVQGTFGSEAPPEVGDEIFLDLDLLRDFDGPDLLFSRNSDFKKKVYIPVSDRFREIPIVLHRRFQSKKDRHVVEVQLISNDFDRAQIWIFSWGYTPDPAEPRSDLNLDCYRYEMS